MTADHIPEDIKNFILSNIDSVEQLEILILMLRNVDNHWTAEALSRELRSNLSYVDAQLIALKSAGIIQTSDETHYKFSPSSSELDLLIKKSIDLYRERKVSVINLIYNKPAERIKGIADAFKFRRDK